MKIEVKHIRYFFSIAFLPCLLWAQTSKFEINGYGKYMFSSRLYPDSDVHFEDQYLHTRINSKWYPTPNLTGALEFRIRGIYGETVRNTSNYIDQIKSTRDFARLDAVLWNRKSTVGYAEIDRLWFDYTKNKFQLTAGRQRIAWGTSWVWNPIDIFNPYSVLDFDYEEKPGVDALRVQYYTSAVSKVELSIKPGKSESDRIIGGLCSLNAGEYDFNLIAATRNQRWILGGGWVGDIHDAGFRGEFTVSKNFTDQDEYIGDFVSGFPSYRYAGTYNKPVVSFVLSGDYTFPNSFYVHTEVLHNSNGKTDDILVYQTQALENGMLTAAKWSIYQEFAYEISPLMRGSVFCLFNPNDKSSVVVPSLNYSICTNLDLMAICLLFNGKTATEYGDYGKTILLRVKYSF